MAVLLKLLLLGALIALLAWWLVRAARGRQVQRDAAPELPPPEGMLRCAHCGVHLPRSEALPLGEHAYCSAAHRDAGPRDRNG